MTVAKRQKIMYGILVVALLWGGWNMTHPRKRTVPPQDTSAPISEATSTAQPTISTEVAASLEARPWGRDPFSTSSARYNAETTLRQPAKRSTETRAVSWSLTGIIDNGATPFAFINGRMVKVGDLIDQARVVKIEKQKVTLSHNGNEILLRVNKG
ncbi:MAG: hypothetical protein NDJ18_03160 [candidate division Zixibacteria bacterium]|nr:hypothetical protein [candidate division Zixibacteria bacterium]